MDRTGYANLCRLLTLGRLRSPKGESRVDWKEVCWHAEGLIALWGGEGSLIAAGSVVKSGTKIPAHSMAAGNPAVVKRKVSSDEREYFIEWAKNYRGYSKGIQI